MNLSPDVFIQWFRYAVGRIGRGYYGHSERVYCYELYHYIRVAMHYYESKFGRIDEVFLHSELVKRVISEEGARMYQVTPLVARRMPDFLFHTPGNFNNQFAAIEVKANPQLQRGELVDDLEKLTELCESYKYELGVFHCVNIESRRLRELLNPDFVDYSSLDPNLLIECKPGFGVPLESRLLGSFLT